MKKISIILLLFVCFLSVNAQMSLVPLSVNDVGLSIVPMGGAGLKIPCDFVLRTSENVLVANQNISVQVSVFDKTGAQVYMEIHNTSTNENGLVKLRIGSGSVSVGDFQKIDWNNAVIKNSINVNGEIVETIVPVSAVPAASYAVSIDKTFLENYLTVNNYAKISDLPANQVPADWNQTDSSQPDYIKNKPEIPEQYNINCPNEDFCSSFAKVQEYINKTKTFLNALN